MLTGATVLPDGTPVRGRGLREALPPGPEPEAALHLARPGLLVRRGLRPAPPAPTWPVEHVDWPDFRTPRDPRAAAAAIVRAYDLARAGRRVEVVCGGGNGRTGTAVACLAVLAGHPPADAVAWTREHYRRRAVETPGQRRWVAWFAAHTGRPPT